MLNEQQQQAYLYNQMAQAAGHPQQMLDQDGQQVIMDQSAVMGAESNQEMDGQPQS